MTQVGVLDGFNGGISQSAGIIRMAIAGGDWVNIGSGGLYTNFVQGNVGIGTTTQEVSLQWSAPHLLLGMC